MARRRKKVEQPTENKVVESSVPVEPTTEKSYRELLHEGLESVEAKIIAQMPTKHELKSGNAKTVEKIIKFETTCHHLVETWRDLKKKLGIKKTLESIRPSGITILPGQNVGRIL